MRDLIKLMEAASGVEQAVSDVNGQLYGDLAGQCEGAAGDLALRLQAAGHDARAVQGFYDRPMSYGEGFDDTRTPHCWVEVGDFILDPTVQQFGSGAMIVRKGTPLAAKYDAQGELQLHESVLTEGRDAPLFHGTNPHSAVRILQDNKIEAHTKHFDADHQALWRVPGVSLSRDYRAAKRFGGIVFVLDQTKLVQTKQITPISYWGKSKEPGMAGENHRTGQFAEAEEFVTGSISIPKYCTEIRMDRTTFDRLTQKRGAPFEDEHKFYRPLTTHPLLRINQRRIS